MEKSFSIKTESWLPDAKNNGKRKNLFHCHEKFASSAIFTPYHCKTNQWERFLQRMSKFSHRKIVPEIIDDFDMSGKEMEMNLEEIEWINKNL